MEQIRITIGTDGTTRIEVMGAEGECCEKMTEGFEKRLGVAVGDRTFKPEYYVDPEYIVEQQTEYDT